MADKDLLEIIADMLRKDQHFQEFKEQGKTLEVYSEGLKSKEKC